MSASKDKILRKELRENGQDKRTLAAEKEAKERKKTRVKYGIIALVIVLLFTFIFVYNSALPSKLLKGVTIGEEEYSVAELNYYYSNSYQNFYSTYYTYISYGMFFNTSEKLEDQIYYEDTTWRDYFIEQATASMQQVQVLYNAGKDAGFEMPEDAQTEYEETLESLSTAWASNGYQSEAQFLNMIYGKGVNEELVEEQLYRSAYAAAYAEEIYDGFEYEESELKDYYEENKDSMDYIEYAYCVASVVDDEETDTATEESFNAVLEKIDGTDRATFEEVAEEELEETVNYNNTQGENLAEAYAEWLLDSARTEGESTVITTEDSYYLVMFLGRNDNDYATRAMRHILIDAVDEDGDGVYSDEEVQAALDQANEIYEEWKSGEATEESFAELANEYSEDTGSNTTGGLYEDIVKDQMVSPINDWLFNEASSAGDTTVVVYNEGGSYTGAHIVYYVGEAEDVYADVLADNDLRNTDYNEWLESQEEGMEIKTSNLFFACNNY